MMNLTKTILKGTIRLGRGTATVMGLAVLLALTVGLASTALAGTSVGARFDLGKTNTVDAVSQLVGTTTGPMLRISNSSPDNPKVNNPALDLEVAPGNSPMEVNSSLKVEDLNADELDGLDSSRFVTTFGKASDSDRLDGRDSSDFLSRKTYVSLGDPLLVPIRKVHTVRESCDSGDVALSGGYKLATSGTSTVRSEITSGSEHVVEVVAPPDTSVTALATVTCADFAPLR